MKTTEQNIINFINYHNLIDEGDKILIALSGGPDSVFLLRFLFKYKKRFKISIFAAHINHNLRGNDSDNDEIFCENLCSELNVPFFAENIDVKKFAKDSKFSIEQAARILRYEALNKIAGGNSLNKIATAHNLNDNAETVLLNLFKGTGLAGLAGIPVSRENIIRPILNLPKEKILEYLNRNGFNYRIDKSNLTDDYQRNFIRNEIIPLLKSKINPSVEKAVFRTSEIIKGEKEILDAYLNENLNSYMEFNNGKLKIDISHLTKLNKSFFVELLRKGFNKFYGINYSYKNLMDIKKLFDNQVGKNITLANGIKVFRERNKLVILNEKMQRLSGIYKIKPDESVKTEFGEIGIKSIDKSEVKFNNSKKEELISADNIGNIFILREWKFGDKFIPLGMKTFKKISDFLNEQKIESNKKKGQFVLTNKGRIVWVVGLRIDERNKITSNTKKVYKLWMDY